MLALEVLVVTCYLHIVSGMIHSVCRQEGWRLEHKDPRDSSSEIIFKGIVFNEMKGYFVRVCVYMYKRN